MKHDIKYYFHIWKNFTTYNIDILPNPDKPQSGDDYCEGCIDSECGECDDCFDDEIIEGYL